MKNIFISSTFRDMQAERDMVHEYVVPALRSKARKYGENVNVIDLRWGVDTSQLETDEGSKKVLSVCFDEIDKSRPYMLVFVGDRYGWIPDERIIRDIVEKRGSLVTDGDLEKSVTALEIEYGALSEELGTSDRCIICFRELDTNGIKDENLRKIYIEQNEKGIEKLKLLKEKLKSTLGDKIITYKATWDEEKQSISEFITDSGEPLYDAITKKYINLFIDEWKEKENFSWQEFEMLGAEAMAENRLRFFHGRERVIDSYKQLIEKEKKYILLRGEVGSGKSSVLAKLSGYYIENNKPVFKFFSGSGARSCTAEDLVRQLVYYTETLLHKEHVNADYLELVNRLNNLFSECTDDIYIFIDALDQMTQDYHIKSFDFIPKLYDNVHIFMTANYELNIDNLAKDDLAKLTITTLPKLTKEESREVIQGILTGYAKGSYDSIVDAVLKRVNATNPLYISLLIQRLNMMGEDELKDALNEQDIVNKCTELINDVPNNLEEAAAYVVYQAINHVSDNDSEKVGLKAILSLISHTRRGLRIEDIVDICNVEDITFNQLAFSRLLKYVDTFFIEREDGCIDYSHLAIKRGLMGQADGIDNEDCYRIIANRLIRTEKGDSLKANEGAWHSYKDRNFELLSNLFVESCESINSDEDVHDDIIFSIKEMVMLDKGQFLADYLSSCDDIYVTVDDKISSVCYELSNDFWKCFGISKEELDVETFLLSTFIERLGEKNNQALKYVRARNLIELCEANTNAGRMQKAIEAGEKAESLFRSVESEENEYLEDILLCNRRIANAYFELGYADKALPYYREAGKHYEALLEKGESVNIIAKLCEVYGFLGDVFFYKSRYKKALSYFEKSLLYSKRLMELRGDDLSSFDYANLGLAYSRVGKSYTYLDEHEKAEEPLNLGIKYCRMAYDETRDLEHLRALCLNEGVMISVMHQRADYDEALKYAKLNLEHIMELYDRTKGTVVFIGISESYFQTGACYIGKGMYDEAAKCFDETMKYMVKAYHDENNARHMYERANLYASIAECYNHSKIEKRDKQIIQLKYYKDSIEMFKKAHELERNFDYERAIYNYCNIVVGILTDLGKKKEADSYLKSYLRWRNSVS